jgi:hypothetical protein
MQLLAGQFLVCVVTTMMVVTKVNVCFVQLLIRSPRTVVTAIMVCGQHC